MLQDLDPPSQLSLPEVGALPLSTPLSEMQGPPIRDDSFGLQVTLIGLPQEQGAAGKASKSDSYAIDKMSIRVSPKVFGARIRWDGVSGLSSQAQQ